MSSAGKPEPSGSGPIRPLKSRLYEYLRNIRWQIEAQIRRMAGRFFPLKPAMHVVGDSHAKFNFRDAGEFIVHYLGPVTMHRVGRDGRSLVRAVDLHVHDGDTVVWCLGEIDVRCHIVRQAERQNETVRGIVGRLAESFLHSVQDIQRDASGLQTIVLAVIPPTDQVTNEEFPTVGSLPERIKVRNLLNEALRRGCLSLGFRFLDPFPRFADSTGALKADMSDGNVHCGPAYASIITDQVRRFAASG
jgi:hypothetical protein